MTIKVNSNNLIFLNNLNSASDRLATAMARLSSGARIQSAGDDAAGFMISKGLEVKQRGLNTANNNIQMGLSLLGIAEGSIQTMLSPLYRIRDLALQSSNGIYSDAERKAMQMEVDSLFEEITRIKNTTEFNGVNLFGQQIYKDKSETFVDNETAAAISLLSYTPAPMMMSMSPSAEQETETPIATPQTAPEVSLMSIEPETQTQSSEEPVANQTPIMRSAPMMRSAAPNLNEGSIAVASGETITLEVAGKTYSVSNWGGGTELNYSYNETTGAITFNGSSGFDIRSAAGQTNNVIINGNGMIFGGSDENDQIIVNGTDSNIYAEGGNDTVIANADTVYIDTGNNDDQIILNGKLTNAYAGIQGGSGNDTIIVNSSDNLGAINGGAGDDTITINGSNNTVDGGAGNNTLNLAASATGTTQSNINKTIALNNSGSIMLDYGEETTLEIAGKSYTVINNDLDEYATRTLSYEYDSTTGAITFDGDYFIIASASGQENNVILRGECINFSGSEKDDIITDYGNYTTIYGNAGNDIIYGDYNSRLYGGEGNDIIYGDDCLIYGNAGNDVITGYGRTTIYGGEGDDTINNVGYDSSINGDEGNDTITSTGQEPMIQGGEGDDTITSDGEYSALYGDEGNDTIKSNGANNTIDGGTGNNILSLGADTTGTTFNNINKIIALDNSGSIALKTDEEIYFEINGKEYYLYSYKNQTINYSLQNSVLTIEGNELYIEDLGDQEDNLHIIGDGNYIETHVGNDKITVDGNDNEIRAGDGNDTVIMTGEYNYGYGDADNDIVTIEGNFSRGYGVDGNDIVNVTGSGSFGSGGAGDDTITVIGDDTTGTAGTGNDIVTIIGQNVTARGTRGANTLYVYGDSALVQGGSDNDHITVVGDSAEIRTNHGEDTVTLTGDNGEINVGYIYTGNKNITVNGSNHIIELTDGDNTVNANGSGIDIFLGEGNNNVTIKGDDIDVTAGDGNNRINSEGDLNWITTGSGDNVINSKGYSGLVCAENGNNIIRSEGNFNEIIVGGSGGGGDNTIILRGNDNSIMTEAGNDTVSVDGVCNNIQLGAGNDTAIILGDLNTIDGGEDYDIITNGGTNTTISNCDILHKEADPFVFQVGTEANSNSTIEVSTGFVLPILGVDISNAESARASLEDIDRVIEALTVKLGEIGVSKNRLESALSANEVAEINIAAARSNIVDADIAQESMEFLKAQILQNASASLLTASRDISSTSLLNIYNSLGNLR